MSDIPTADSTYHERKSMYVNESGFYKMLLGSQKPEAERLQRWVTKDVLPSIRRTGRAAVQRADDQAEPRLPPSAPSPEPRAAAPPRHPRRTAGLPIRGEENIESLRSAPVPPGRADDPDLEAYRNAGIPDDALPISAEEAERWRVLAAKWKQRAIQFRTGRVIILVPRGSVGYDGEPSTQWEPVARALAE
jgi:hypothetical protein